MVRELMAQTSLQRTYPREPDAMEYWQCETHPTMARHAKRHNAEISF
jgi:hypothetical protein